MAENTDNNDYPPKANLAEGEDTIVAVVSQVNLVTNVCKWVVDSGATRHICANRNVFTSYTSGGNGEEKVYLGDSRTTPVLGKGKVLLKLTYGKLWLWVMCYMCHQLELIWSLWHC